jgi:hypothetical protein
MIAEFWFTNNSHHKVAVFIILLTMAALNVNIQYYPALNSN